MSECCPTCEVRAAAVVLIEHADQLALGTRIVALQRELAALRAALGRHEGD